MSPSSETSGEQLFHLSPDTGKISRCRAEKGGCPFNDPEDPNGGHYTTEAEIEAYAERKSKEVPLESSGELSEEQLMSLKIGLESGYGDIIEGSNFKYLEIVDPRDGQLKYASDVEELLFELDNKGYITYEPGANSNKGTIYINESPDKVPTGAGEGSVHTLSDLAPMEEWEKALEEGRVTRRDNGDGLYTWKYSFKTTADNSWDAVTRNARGLLTDYEGNIVARPFPKFFEWGEIHHKPEEQVGFTGPMVISDKLDGSLGILYRHPQTGEMKLSTAGSTGSNEAKIATEIYKEKYLDSFTPDENYTYLYEIITPDNRVVLDYGDERDLKLIGKIHKSTGKQVPLNEVPEWPGKTAEIFEGIETFEDALNYPPRPGREGLIVHFTDTDARVKLKQEDYVITHRLIGWNPKKGTKAIKDVWLLNDPKHLDYASGILKKTEKREKSHPNFSGETRYDAFAKTIAKYSRKEREVKENLSATMKVIEDKKLTGKDVVDTCRERGTDPSLVFPILKGIRTVDEQARTAAVK